MPSPILSYPVLRCPLPDRVAPVFVQVVSSPLGWSPLSYFLVQVVTHEVQQSSLWWVDRAASTDDMGCCCWFHATLTQLQLSFLNRPQNNMFPSWHQISRGRPRTFWLKNIDNILLLLWFTGQTSIWKASPRHAQEKRRRKK